MKIRLFVIGTSLILSMYSCGSDDSPCTESTWYEDLDGDGDGNPNVSQSACEQPDGFVANSNDTNDKEGLLIADGQSYVFAFARLIRPMDLVDGSPLYPYRIALFVEENSRNSDAVVVSFNVHPPNTAPTDSGITVGTFDLCECPGQDETGLKELGVDFQTNIRSLNINDSKGSITITGSGRNLAVQSNGVELEDGSTLEFQFEGTFRN